MGEPCTRDLIHDDLFVRFPQGLQARLWQIFACFIVGPNQRVSSFSSAG